MRRKALLAATAAVALAAGIPLAVGTSSTPAHAAGISYNQLSQVQKRLLSGGSAFALQDTGTNGNSSYAPTYSPRGNGDKGCQDNVSSNIKVNANCLNLTDPDLAGRGQANNETSIAYDPNNTQVMLASANDYRRGDGNCYTSYSGDGGRTWQDSTVPTGFTRGKVANVVDLGASREYWHGGGDTSVAFDTKGNAYLSCQLIMRGQPTTNNPDASSALVVYRSTQNGGASWNFPGRYVRASADVAGTGIPPFLDKQLMTVDNHVGSPFQDRIYVSWTEFASDGSAFIYEAYSADYGEHFSSPHLVSVNNSTLCVQTFGVGTVATTGENSQCNENQFSQPFTGPDGNLYVAFANFNNAVSAGIQDDGGDDSGAANTNAAGAAPATPADNRNQMLLAKSVDGGNTFLPPVKISDYYELPDCATYQAGQDFGRACVPEKGPTANSVFRATQYPSGVVDPTNPNRVVVTFGSYINQHSNEANGCVPTGFNPADGQNLYTGVKTLGACNNDILISVSNDKGTTFSGAAVDPRVEPVVTTDPGQATTDQWWQWIDYTKTGKLAVSYYDRQYGTDEVTGFSDFSLSGSKDLINYGVVRVTSSSNPPPTEFGGVFMGDYTGLTAPSNANPLWTDTRSPDLFLCPGTGAVGSPPQICTASAPNAAVANDEELRTANIPVPGS